MLYNNGDQFNQIYYQGKSVGQIWKNGVCIYPGRPVTKLIESLGLTWSEMSYTTTVTAIIRSSTPPPTGYNYTISTEDSEYPIYTWIRNRIIYYYTVATTIYCSSPCSLGSRYSSNYYPTSITDISGVADWDLSNTNSLSSCFRLFKSLSDISPIAQWNTSKITNLTGLFTSCSSLSDISPIYNWDLSSLGASSFDQTFAVTIIPKCDFTQLKFDTNVNLYGTFAQCKELTICDLGYHILSIGTSCFKDCSNLITLIIRRTDRITYLSTLATVSPFDGATKLRSTYGKLYVPQALIDSYGNDSLWRLELLNFGCQVLPLEGSPYEQPGSI